jgi:hypothetical protein
MRFVPFTEENDWEGETWTFWLQLDGNEDELVRLNELTHESETYHLSLNDIESEETVDRMVRRAKVGYMYSDNKVVGRFLCPEVNSKEPVHALEDLFYKGGIEGYFQE